MRQLSSGSVTFLFTDIEGSTRLLQELGDDYAPVLAEHRLVLRDACGRHGGVEVDTQGDAFFFAFETAHDALAVAREAQDALRSAAVRVRMGLHTGEPILTEEGYVGIDVHRAARVAAAGHGGQVLLSRTTRDLLGSDAGLHYLGEHRLKDLLEPEPLYQLGDGEFPPLHTIHEASLPVQPTPLIGRARELAEVVGLLRTNRVVTLTGPGGSGKTRVALQAAAELLDDFRDGVWFVALSPIRDADLVLPTIGQTLGVREPQTPAEHLRDKTTLLVLDNFEHLLDAVPSLAGLLAAAPALKLLVTSRASLRVAGEQELPLPPLADDEAVALFAERAHAMSPSVGL